MRLIKTSAKYTLLSVLVLIYSCNKTETDQTNSINIKNCKKISSLEYNDEDIIESYSLIKLELNDESILGEISQIQLFDDKLYILDRIVGQLAVYNTNGTFSHKIGQRGRGPAEYLALNAFYINPDFTTITLFDPLGVKTITYDLTGNYIESKTPDKDVVIQGINNIKYLGDNKILCFASPSGLMEDILFILNGNDLTLHEKLVTRPFDIDNAVYRMAIQPFSLIDGKVNFVKWFDNTIYTHNQGQIKSSIKIDLDKEIVPDKILESIATDKSGEFSSVIFEILNNGKYSVGLENLYETERFIFCEYKSTQITSLLIWDKQKNKGLYAPNKYMMSYGFDNIIYSDGNTLICNWSSNSIQRFINDIDTEKLETINSFDSKIIDTANSYNDMNDNPVLFIYTIKK